MGPLVGISAVLLVLLLVPWTLSIAPVINGARRWIDLGVTFQPSEIAKFAVVVWTAHLAVRKQDRLHSLRYGLLPFSPPDDQPTEYSVSAGTALSFAGGRASFDATVERIFRDGAGAKEDTWYLMFALTVLP